MTEQKTQWHLDLKVTLTLIFGLFIHAASSIWWASQIDTNLKAHAVRIEANAANIRDLESQGGGIREHLVSIQKTQEFQTQMLQEVRSELRGNRGGR